MGTLGNIYFLYLLLPSPTFSSMHLCKECGACFCLLIISPTFLPARQALPSHGYFSSRYRCWLNRDFFSFLIFICLFLADETPVCLKALCNSKINVCGDLAYLSQLFKYLSIAGPKVTGSFSKCESIKFECSIHFVLILSVPFNSDPLFTFNLKSRLTFSS